MNGRVSDMTASTVYAGLGLSRNPFPPTPDAGSFFFTPKLEEEFAEIVHCFEARKGFVLLTGEVGLGKSTLVRRLLDTLSPERCRSALVLNTFLQGESLLATLCADFGLPATASMEAGLQQLDRFLIDMHRQGRTCLLVIDDAQNLSVSSLELVRLLCNLETGQEKLLQIVLVGQPELEESLARPELRQLKSRIVKHARLHGLEREALGRYFDFRVNSAGASGRLSLQPAAADLLHRATQGNLRQVHLVLDRCLYGLAGARQTDIGVALVHRAVAEVPSLQYGADKPVRAKRAGPGLRRSAWVWGGGLAGLATTVALAGAVGVFDGRMKPVVVAVELPMPVPAPAAVSVSASGSAPAPAPASEPTPREVCVGRVQAAHAGANVQVLHVPPEWARLLPATDRLCVFEQDQALSVAAVGGGGGRLIQSAQQLTRQVQGALKGWGLLDTAPDGAFGPRTAEALARFQAQHRLPPTGQPDELTLLLLENLDARDH